MTHRLSRRLIIGLVLGPSTPLYRSLLEHCTVTSKTSLEKARPWSSSPLVVSQDSSSPWTCARFQMGRVKHTPVDVFIYFWYTFHITFAWCFFFPLRFGWLLVFGLYKEDYLQFLCVSVWLHTFHGYWEGWDPTGLTTQVWWLTPTWSPM